MNSESTERYERRLKALTEELERHRKFETRLKWAFGVGVAVVLLTAINRSLIFEIVRFAVGLAGIAIPIAGYLLWSGRKTSRDLYSRLSELEKALSEQGYQLGYDGSLGLKPDPEHEFAERERLNRIRIARGAAEQKIPNAIAQLEAMDVNSEARLIWRTLSGGEPLTEWQVSEQSSLPLDITCLWTLTFQRLDLVTAIGTALREPKYWVPPNIAPSPIVDQLSHDC